MTETVAPHPSRPRLHVGLTGGIAAGKSTVARVFAERGAILVDADKIARDVLARGTEGLAAVQDEFGDRVITAEGDLDRAAMAEIVFTDPAERDRLNRIVHPRIRAFGRRLVAEGKVIEAIKVYREHTGAGLKEAKDAIDRHRGVV